MTGKSICKKGLTWRPGEQSRRGQDEVREAEHCTLLHKQQTLMTAKNRTHGRTRPSDHQTNRTEEPREGQTPGVTNSFLLFSLTSSSFFLTSRIWCYDCSPKRMFVRHDYLYFIPQLTGLCSQADFSRRDHRQYTVVSTGDSAKFLRCSCSWQWPPQRSEHQVCGSLFQVPTFEWWQSLLLSPSI